MASERTGRLTGGVLWFPDGFIRTYAGWRCEWCGLEVVGHRMSDVDWHTIKCLKIQATR